MALPDPIRGTTQDFTEIEDIRDDVILLRDGSCCVILETTATNFGLLSEKEQEALIFAYAGLLNSLTFPLQIVIRSQKKDVSSYLKLLDQAKDSQPNPDLKNKISQYKDFIVKTVAQNNVLDKKFYLSIPFSSLELGVKSATKSFTGKSGLPLPKEYILNRAKMVLLPKKDHILRLLGRLGLHGRQLTTKELISLFHNIYNPESPVQNLQEAESYETAIVGMKK